MDEAKLERLLNVFDRRSWEINREYLIKAAKHLKEIGLLPPSDIHRIAEMRRMRTSMKEISRTIAEALGTDEKDVDTVLAQVAKENDWAARTMLAYGGARVPITENEPLMRMLEAASRLTKGNLTNLSNTTIDSLGYQQAIDRAIHAVNTGVGDYGSVIRRSISELAQDGLRVRYPSGRTMRLDSAVRMNVLDGARQVNAESMRILGEGYGADGVEIDAHMLCADDHLPYQGMQYTLDEFQDIQDGLMRPFGQWNCRHNIHYIILGVSPRNYTDRELEEMKQFSTEKIEIDGVKKTRYEWSQTMRRLETKTRYQNDETEALKAIGDKQGARISDEKAARIVDAYNKVCQAVGLEPRYDRMYVGRYVPPRPGELAHGGNVQRLTIAQGNAKIIPPFRMNLQLFAAPRDPQKYKTVYLERREYAHVVSEINTHLSDEQKEQRIVTKAIGDFVYTFINNGFNNYRFIDRVPIDQETIDEVDS